MCYLLICLMLFVSFVFVVQFDEVLFDFVFEVCVCEILKILCCLVCVGEIIDELNVLISCDLWFYLCEWLVVGDSNDVVVDVVVDRFGEYVLFQLCVQGINWLLYLVGLVMVFLGLLIGWQFIWLCVVLIEFVFECLIEDEKVWLDWIMCD